MPEYGKVDIAEVQFGSQAFIGCCFYLGDDFIFKKVWEGGKCAYEDNKNDPESDQNFFDAHDGKHNLDARYNGLE